MNDNIYVSFQDWKIYLEKCVERYNTYAPLHENGFIDYEIIHKALIEKIVYNHPKPISPLKIFFIPPKENVARINESPKQNLIIGVPSCDLVALDILDEIYLSEPFIDIFYKKRRENAILIGADCHSIQDSCHCNSYDIKAYPYKNFDVSISIIADKVFLSANSDKGKLFLNDIKEQMAWKEIEEADQKLVSSKREMVKGLLAEQNKNLPNYKETGRIVAESDLSVWEKHSKKCVSCGACATICPTCTCFLLVDRPDFDKVRTIDACQYPGFTRIAAGEDLLKNRATRFKNRYFCKYVWKPEKFDSIACTGCGRCIDSCIGNINKNKLFKEQACAVEL